MQKITILLNPWVVQGTIKIHNGVVIFRSNGTLPIDGMVVPNALISLPFGLINATMEKWGSGARTLNILKNHITVLSK